MEETTMEQQTQGEKIEGGDNGTKIKGLVAESYNPAEYISRNLKSGFGE